MNAMIPCPSCGRPSDGRGTYCAKCGTAIVGRQPPARQSAPPPAAAVTVRPPARGILRPLLAILFLALVAAGVYWGYWEHGFEWVELMLRPAFAPVAPVAAPPQVFSPDVEPLAGSAVGATFERVWIEGDTVDADGYAGLRVRARVHGLTGSQLTFCAHFYYSDGTRVRAADARYRDPDECAATSTKFIPSAGRSEVSAFIPRGAMSLDPGEHSLRVLPALLDSQGHEIITAPAVNITARRDSSFITRVRAERAADSFGGAGRVVVLKVSFVLDHSLNGQMGEAVAQFRDSRGQDLVGRAPYANGANVLTAYKDFRGAWQQGVQRYDDIAVIIPAYLLPEGASAVVMVQDPSTRKAVTDAVRCRVPP